MIILVLTNYTQVVSTAHCFSFSISKQAAIQIPPNPEKMKKEFIMGEAVYSVVTAAPFPISL